MNDTALQEVEDFISNIQSINLEHAEIIKQVRDLFMEENEEIFVGIKYDGLAFFQKGVLIGGIFPYRKHLSIEFTNDANFSDPSSELEGKGKKRRHLKIFTAEDIGAKDALYFVKQAVSE